MLGLLADDRGAFGGGEPGDEADFRLRASGVIPGQPHAVRMPQLRPAVVPGELLGGEDEFSIRLDLIRCSALFDKRVDHQRAVDRDGLVPPGAEEHQLATEAPRRSAIRLLQNGVGPQRDDLGRRHRRFLGPREPRDRTAEL